jgi:NAD-dependent deacetylase
VDIQQLASRIREATRVTVLTGAGISTDSGIPDFRGPQGLWTKDPAAEKLFTLQNYMSDPEIRARSWRTRLEHPAWNASPGPGHLALAELERKGRLDTLITQNIDGLHQAAGTSEDRLIEIHGSIREVQCMSCDARRPMKEALARVEAGEEDPPCRACGGILKSATISFGQSLVREDLERARRAAERSDLFLPVGTSLQVAPVSYLPALALRAGAFLAVVNAEPTPFDEAAGAVVREPIGEVLPLLIGLV